MDEKSDLGEKLIKIIIPMHSKRRTNRIALSNRGRAHGGPWRLPWLVGVQERGHICLLEVRKEMVGIEKDLGRMVIC